ncbi:transporter substrate-binding domain-containing protein [Clostridium sp. SHJSY1]|uniref:substrate-binding periplasmic protein n=1 Tax=Clostridium sp. SHJSY1 TaxID=2942483 RepID=UPI002875CDA8|nr:transporter substrate-binding domain-containing protein [Clostridium sp. SHJSY1]MDS0526731.1 transporter substrate-binding domain-containing protein [Clostridium sp. SHJSY1]
MKKYLKFLISLIIIINTTNIIGKATIQVPNNNKASINEVDRLQKIKERGELTVLSSNDEPYSYRDPKTGTFSGIDADIIREVAKRLGIKEVRAKYIPFVNLFDELIKNNNIDLIVDGISITDERKKLVDFTIPIYKDSGGLVIRTDLGISSKEDLKSRTLGIIGGSVYLEEAEKLKKEGKIKNYIAFSDANSLILGMKNRIIDAFLTDSIIGQDIIVKNPQLNFRILSPNEYPPNIVYNMGYPLRKNDTVLLNAINQKLQEMKDDGTIYEILIKYGLFGNYVD